MLTKPPPRGRRSRSPWPLATLPRIPIALTTMLFATSYITARWPTGRLALQTCAESWTSRRSATAVPLLNTLSNCRPPNKANLIAQRHFEAKQTMRQQPPNPEYKPPGQRTPPTGRALRTTSRSPRPCSSSSPRPPPLPNGWFTAQWSQTSYRLLSGPSLPTTGCCCRIASGAHCWSPCTTSSRPTSTASLSWLRALLHSTSSSSSRLLRTLTVTILQTKKPGNPSSKACCLCASSPRCSTRT